MPEKKAPHAELPYPQLVEGRRTKNRHAADHGQAESDLAAVAQQAGAVAAPVALLLGLALVALALALGQAELDLGDAAGVEVDRQRHQGHAVALDSDAQPAEHEP